MAADGDGRTSCCHSSECRDQDGRSAAAFAAITTASSSQPPPMFPGAAFSPA
jgi:hypothetical protein